MMATEGKIYSSQISKSKVMLCYMNAREFDDGFVCCPWCGRINDMTGTHSSSGWMKHQLLKHGDNKHVIRAMKIREIIKEEGVDYPDYDAFKKRVWDLMDIVHYEMGVW